MLFQFLAEIIAIIVLMGISFLVIFTIIAFCFYLLCEVYKINVENSRFSNIYNHLVRKNLKNKK